MTPGGDRQKGAVEWWKHATKSTEIKKVRFQTPGQQSSNLHPLMSNGGDNQTDEARRCLLTALATNCYPEGNGLVGRDIIGQSASIMAAQHSGYVLLACSGSTIDVVDSLEG